MEGTINLKDVKVNPDGDTWSEILGITTEQQMGLAEKLYAHGALRKTPQKVVASVLPHLTEAEAVALIARGIEAFVK